MSGAVVKFSIVVSLALVFSTSAMAAYDHIVDWSDMSAVDLRPALDSQYGSEANLFNPNISQSDYDLALRDADVKISSEFKIPPGMRPLVAFWLKIYTLYTTHNIVIFDKKHPEVIYDVLDFKNLSKTARNRVVYEILAERRTKAAVRNYRAALIALSKNQKPKRPTEYQKRILAALKKTKHKHSYNELARNIRTQTGQRDNIIKGLMAAETFFPKMEQLFQAHRLPLELTRLPLVESSFNLNALSRVGAAGVWQFMLRSAHEFMLVDERVEIDERLSPLKSTVAAAKLLARNKRILKSWPLAITAYNHGIRNLKKIPASSKQFSQIGKLFDPCSETSPLGWASRNYYAEFLAVVYAEAYRKLFYGNPPTDPIKSIAFHKISKSRSALTIAMERSIPLHDFRLLNPDIRNLNKKLPVGLWIAIPAENDDIAGLMKKGLKQALNIS